MNGENEEGGDEMEVQDAKEQDIDSPTPSSNMEQSC